MKINIKKINLIFPLMFILICLSSCILIRDNANVSGCFEYRINNEELYIFKLSEFGEEQETIILPIFIDGFETFINGDSVFESDSLKNIYFNSDILENLNFRFKNRVKLRLKTKNKIKFFMPYTCKCIYITSGEYEFYYSNEALEVDNLDKKLHNVANVSYYYNYEKEDPYTFFIDDVDGEKIVNIPPTPYREGYIFEGWYKEEECINEWNFDVDIVPSKEYTEEGEYIYKETILYAKWKEV